MGHLRAPLPIEKLLPLIILKEMIGCTLSREELYVQKYSNIYNAVIAILPCCIRFCHKKNVTEGSLCCSFCPATPFDREARHHLLNWLHTTERSAAKDFGPRKNAKRLWTTKERERPRTARSSVDRCRQCCTTPNPQCHADPLAVLRACSGRHLTVCLSESTMLVRRVSPRTPYRTR
jgi:hypothetical protein